MYNQLITVFYVNIDFDFAKRKEYSIQVPLLSVVTLTKSCRAPVHPGRDGNTRTKLHSMIKGGVLFCVRKTLVL